jgi:hypothetical protein
MPLTSILSPATATLEFRVMHRSYLSSNSVVVHRFVRPHLMINTVLIVFFPVLDCVLSCPCRDKPSW